MIMLVTTLILASAAAFAPLIVLPGELVTDFVSGSWVLPAGIGVFVLLLAVRLRPLAGSEAEAWWPATCRFMWRFSSAFVGFFWLVGALIWMNAFRVEGARSHDMAVVGYEERSGRRGGSTINHYKLSEIGTGWRADLQPTRARDAFLRVGACVRITVRPGRLGFDWISDARPISCPRQA